MALFEIDKRTKEDIIAYIKEASREYTPEWRFDEENPDVGTSLALIYAEMFYKTIKQWNKIPDKYRIAFFNSIHANLLPAVPAKGYVSFSMVNTQVQGVEVTAKTIVSADSDRKEISSIQYETQDDIYVIPSKLMKIYQVSDKIDYIGLVTEKEGECRFFDFAYENLQKHIMYFGQRDILNIVHSAWIEITFYTRGEQPINTKFLQYFSDKQNVVFDYYSENGYTEFAGIQIKDGKLLCMKTDNQPAFAEKEIEGIKNYWIRCRVKKINPFLSFSAKKIKLKSKSTGIIPDMIYGAGLECNLAEYFPFGERPSFYETVYFASEEVFSKRGSCIELGFNLDFIKIPLENPLPDQEINWNWIMKKSEFKPNYEYDITIEEVIWEYYNGLGWTRLFEDNSYMDIFSVRESTIGQYRYIKFFCPKDIQKIIINSYESYYIRARILKINNFYKLKGSFIVPVLGNTNLQYYYLEQGISIDEMILKNNLETEIISKLNETEIFPFYQTNTRNSAIYLGFQTKLIKGPIKILFTIKENKSRNKNVTPLQWEYSYEKSGFQEFRELNVIDETNQLTKTGLITFMGNENFSKKHLFGQDYYWIRITGETNSIAYIKGIYLNTVKISSIEYRETEYFRMKKYEENKMFSLLHNKIIEGRVWVKEEQEWIEWKEVEDFAFSEKDSRDYLLDRNQGLLLFGNSNHGKVPPSAKEENIKIEYKTGGGDYTNLEIGKLEKLEKSIGFINRVTNPEVLTGGFDIEPISKAIERNAAIVRHHNKAVSVKDFEELSKGFSQNIQKVKCFTGLDENGKEKAGDITLVILQKDYKKGEYLFHLLREELLEYLKDKVPYHLIEQDRLHIIEPSFAEFCLKIEVSVLSFNHVFKTKEKILKRIEQFLDPIKGYYNEKGWEISQFPNNMQIQNSIQDIEGIKFIKNIYISIYIDGIEGRKESDIERLSGNKYVLPVNGQHEVIITVE